MSVLKGIIPKEDTLLLGGYPAKIFEAVDATPTIDVVPVVRCKDCKHWGMHKHLNVPWCFETHIDKSDEGYCDIGERKEDATD